MEWDWIRYLFIDLSTVRSVLFQKAGTREMISLGVKMSSRFKPSLVFVHCYKISRARPVFICWTISTILKLTSISSMWFLR